MSYLSIAKEAEARLGLSDVPATPPIPEPDTPRQLTERTAELLGMPLARFAADGQPLEVRVPWWPTTHFFVPTLRDVEALTRDGIGRERIWLPVELAELVDAGASVEALRGRTVVRLVVREFGGEVTDVRMSPPVDGAGAPGR